MPAAPRRALPPIPTAALAVLALAALAGCAPSLRPGPAAGNWAPARQMVLVTTPGWDSPRGQLQRFERAPGGRWQPVAAPHAVMVGRAGSAWGLGLHPAPPSGPRKREGDGRAPAGVFNIGTAFGYGASAATALPYAAMDARDWCIDVPASPLYNRIVDAGEVGEAAIAGSTEPMRRDLHADGDQRYRLGLVVEHNPDNTPGMGSCIFAHLWKSPDDATAGCTAMPDSAMTDLLAWLRPDAHPVFVLLPAAELARLHVQWDLPAQAGGAR